MAAVVMAMEETEAAAKVRWVETVVVKEAPTVVAKEVAKEVVKEAAKEAAREVAEEVAEEVAKQGMIMMVGMVVVVVVEEMAAAMAAEMAAMEAAAMEAVVVKEAATVVANEVAIETAKEVAKEAAVVGMAATATVVASRPARTTNRDLQQQPSRSRDARLRQMYGCTKRRRETSETRAPKINRL